MRYVTVTPAYGVDYKNQAEVKKAWADGKDFYIQDFKLSGYISNREVKPNMAIMVRYAKLTKVVQVTK